MACEMCAGTKERKAAAEVVDGSFARRPYPEDAIAELDEGGVIWIETPFEDKGGQRYSILLPAEFCPWCGEHLPIGE